MRAKIEIIDMVPKGVPPRPEGNQNATGEERVTTVNTDAVNDGRRPKPKGNLQPENVHWERSRTTLRETIHMATWNVQGLTTPGKLAGVENEMERCDISILGLSETWWLQEGRLETIKNNMVVYSGKKEGRRSHGVGFIVEKNTAKSVPGYNPVNNRIITLRINAKPINMIIIQVYASTNTASDDQIDDFYGNLEDVLDKLPRRDLIILMGDFNAKIGKLHEKHDNIGVYGLGERNERGDRL